MQAQITVKNYRCFPDELPLRFDLSPGFTAFVGTNNSGKSSILRLFFEIRELLGLTSNINTLTHLSRGGQQQFNFARSVTDVNDFYSNLNQRDVEIAFDFPRPTDVPADFLHRLKLTLKRGSNNYTGQFTGNAGIVQPNANNGYVSNVILRDANNSQTLNASNWIDMASQLTKGSLYRSVPKCCERGHERELLRY